MELREAVDEALEAFRPAMAKEGVSLNIDAAELEGLTITMVPHRIVCADCVMKADDLRELLEMALSLRLDTVPPIRVNRDF